MFKLNFEILPSTSKIDLKDKIYLAGSCFSEEIAEKLRENKFDCLSNPFGTIYNPISIFKTLRNEIDPSNIIQSQSVFHHWDCGKISGLTEAESIEKVELTCEKSTSFLTKTNYLIITLGTSFIYRLKATNRIVANCHKIPSGNFTKEILSKNEIVADFSSTYKDLIKKNPTLRILFTVSPVRHIRDGLIENNLSKAILIESVHEIVKKFDNIQYFPSYEIMMDELRDYRFFAKDLIHPSEEAIDYIWNKFSETFFDSDTKKFIEEWVKISHAMSHKPLQNKSIEHQKFLKQTLIKLQELKSKIDVSEESEILQRQIL